MGVSTFPLSFKGEGDNRGEIDKHPLPLIKGKGIKGTREASPLFESSQLFYINGRRYYYLNPLTIALKGAIVFFHHGY